MTRRKVKLEYIANDSSRRAAFKKRKKGLMKKVGELSTLCGINACAIVYGPYDRQPDLWPPSRVAVQRIISRFKEMPDMEQSKKMVSQEAYLRQRITRANDQLKKHSKENREREVTKMMFNILTSTFTGTAPVWPSLRVMDLHDLGWVVDQYCKDVVKGPKTSKRPWGSAAAKLRHPCHRRLMCQRRNILRLKEWGKWTLAYKSDHGSSTWPIPRAQCANILWERADAASFGGNPNNNTTNNPQNVVWPNSSSSSSSGNPPNVVWPNNQNVVWPNNHPFFP
ncbi:agamous-like MADS-box protein AGL80 [Eucalyptus grandis]|uniref:agamous-like MADS-box protein AGL80 n=1 Tax=Eucalyptus grandis TaxID=71139 RepID=UPI00192EEDFC|nr:agamous-like MADS-box protein AGL80 [Eucalyptus grandis]